MNASELILKLQQLIQEHGDLDVYLTSDYFNGDNIGACYLVRNVEQSHNFGKHNSKFFLIDDIKYF